LDERLRDELLRRGAADSAAVQALLDGAEEFRASWDGRSETPWPYALLEVKDPPEVARRVLDVVRDNTQWLRGVVAERGWPGRSVVGDDGTDAAWLLLQHAGSGVPTIGTPDNLKFQASCVPLLRDAVRVGEVPPRHLAHIVDNLHARAGEDAEFAVLTSAYVRDGDVVVLRPGLNAGRIDDARRRIGLDLIADELQRRQH
jgi:hypothetical protein